jgi:hypothetical protein
VELIATGIGRTQRLKALDRANHVRAARSELKQRIAHGELRAAEVIMSHRWEIQSMQVVELLRSQPQWGVGRCRKFVVSLAMAENKTLGSMTVRQRVAVAALLNRRR